MFDMEFTFNADERAQVMGAYLKSWLDYEPMDRLKEIWKLAEPLGALHQAISYQHILAAIEPTDKPQFVEDLPRWLRRAVRMTPTNPTLTKED